MLFRLIVIVLICYQLLLSGCASDGVSGRLGLALAEGRNSDIVKNLLDEYGDADKMKSSDLSILCSTYGQLKDYNKLFACFDSAQKKIDQSKTKAGC
jgi:hypothetical protein